MRHSTSDPWCRPLQIAGGRLNETTGARLDAAHRASASSLGKLLEGRDPQIDPQGPSGVEGEGPQALTLKGDLALETVDLAVTGIELIHVTDTLSRKTHSQFMKCASHR